MRLHRRQRDLHLALLLVQRGQWEGRRWQVCGGRRGGAVVVARSWSFLDDFHHLGAP